MNGIPRAFRLNVDNAGTTAVVRVTGELDLQTAPELESRLLQLATDGANQVIVDMADTDFIDSTGLHALIVGVKELRGRGGDLVVRAPSPNTARLLQMSGFDTVVQVEGLASPT
ncbi:MAG: STAS domain-containing protein [Acidimicrobiia bacterium]